MDSTVWVLVLEQVSYLYALSQISIDCLGRASDVWCVVPPRVCTLNLVFRALSAELLCCARSQSHTSDIFTWTCAPKSRGESGGDFHGVRRQI